MRKIPGFSLLLVALSGLALASDSVRPRNAEQHFDAVFDRSGVTIDRSGQRLTMPLEGWGAVNAVPHRKDQVERQRGRLVAWYQNSAKGLEQGLTVAERTGPLELPLRVTGDNAAGSSADGLLPSALGGSGAPLQYGVVNEPPVPVSNLVSGDHYGAAIAVSGDTALVGAPDDSSGDGLVYVYVRANGAWVEQQRLHVKSGLRHAFGKSVGVSGDVAIVGAPNENGNAGAVYIFSRSGNHWTQKVRIPEPNSTAGAQFGWAVGIDGTTAIVGSPGLQPVGAAYVFGTDSSGAWSQQSMTSPVGASKVGYSVSIHGNIAAAGGDNNMQLAQRRGLSWTWAFLPLKWGMVDSVAAGPQFVVGGSAASNVGLMVFSSGATWAMSALVPGPGPAGARFGASVAQVGNVVVIGAPGLGRGSAYAFTWLGSTRGSAGPLAELAPNGTVDAGHGAAIAAGANHILVGSPDANNGKGEVDSFRLQNAVIQSNPPGVAFQVSGPGCGGDTTSGILTSPFAGYFTDCTVTWTPGLIPPPPGTRYSYLNWADGVSQNGRKIAEPEDLLNAPITYTGNMLTEYELTTQASPVSGGSVQGAGWFTAGTSARLVAAPNPGFQFAGFTGGHLKTQLNPAAITMNAPTAVTGIFSTTPPASITAMLKPPTGPPHARNWTISVLNEGPGVAYDTNLVLLGFRQTAGAPCVVLPMRLSPVMFPAYVGVMPVRGVANISTTLDFTGCPQDALFTVTVVLTANGGSSGGVVRLMNQGQ